MSPFVVALVGMPGGGKSTVGKQLARQIGVPFVDTDQEIELRIGGSIKQFFERNGEDAFRDLETEVIADLVSQPGDRVLATGGGAYRFADLFRSRGVRVGCALFLFQQLSGINAIIYFSSSVFAKAGVANGALASAVVGLANVLGTALADGVDALNHPLVDHVRGRGLLFGIVLNAPHAKAVETAARAAGFLLNAAAPDVIRLAPPLIITAAQVDDFLAALPGILDAGVST